MATVHEEEHEAVEELADQLYNPADDGKFGLPNAWGTLNIDMTMMEEEDRKKVYAAEILLEEAGIVFDTSSGGGYREWELDWSLSGAFLTVRPLWCLESKKVGHSMGGRIHWAVMRTNDGRVLCDAFCSVECRKKNVERQVSEGYEHIVNVEGVNRSI